MQDSDKLHETHQDNDGIQEYDNPLPSWFVNLFYSTIVFSILYICYYTGFGYGVTQVSGVGQILSFSAAEYLAAVHEAEKSAASIHPQELDHKALEAFMASPASISGGEGIFKANCIACHGVEGQGVVGPNLTDAYWIHGGKPDNVLASVSGGYPAKGMPSWKPVLGEAKVRLATAYVLSLRGHSVANPKAPQGDKE